MVETCTARWSEDLARAAAALAEFNRRIEREFESVGSRLLEFSQRVTGISRHEEALVELLSGTDVTRSTASLATLASRLQTHFERAGDDRKIVESELTTLLESLREIQLAARSFERIVRMLRILGVSTRIESGRMSHAAGFDTLSAEVLQLASTIEACIESLVERRARVERQIAKSLDELHEVARRNDEHADAVVGETRQAADTLAATHTRAASEAGTLVEVSSGIQTAIRSVVMSMQFHDITRQEIEHIEAALRELANGMPENEGEAAAHVAAGARLQSAQLAASTRNIVTAVDRMLASLRDLENSARVLVRRSHETAGMVSGSESSDLNRLESRLEPAIARLAAEHEASRDLTRLLTEVTEDAAAMTEFLRQIERIGSQIQRIALNSRIRAAHTGEEGAALGVLAGAVQNVSSETHQGALRTTEPLRAVRDVSDAVRDRVSASVAADRDDEVAGFGTELAGCVGALRAIGARTAEIVNSQDQAAQALVADLDAVLRGFDVPRLAAEWLGEAGAAIEAVAGSASALAPVDAAAGVDLSASEARYTTATERAVHTSVVDGSSESAAQGSSGEGEFGDNIELF